MTHSIYNFLVTMGCQKATQSAFFGESCSPRPFAKDGSSIKHAPNVAFASGQDRSQVVENWWMHFRITSGWESLDTTIDEVVLSMESSFVDNQVKVVPEPWDRGGVALNTIWSNWCFELFPSTFCFPRSCPFWSSLTSCETSSLGFKLASGSDFLRGEGEGMYKYRVREICMRYVPGR